MKKLKDIVKKAEYFEKLALYGNREFYLKSLNNEGVIEMDPMTIIGDPPAVDKEEQKALSKIVTIEGIGVPLKIDGILGPKTLAAVKAFKEKFNLPYTDRQALTWAKMMAETEDKYKSVPKQDQEIV